MGHHGHSSSNAANTNNENRPVEIINNYYDDKYNTVNQNVDSHNQYNN